MSENKQHALKLARLGFHVFPCHGDGERVKQPYARVYWRSASTTDEKQINTWWDLWPYAAIGLDAAKSSLVIIDADQHREDANGVLALETIFSDHGFVGGDVPVISTPNNGKHFYFRQPAGCSFGNNDSAHYNGISLRELGINIRGNGGYVIAPFTLMGDGRRYVLSGDLGSIPVLPDFFAKILEKSNGNAKNKPVVTAAFPRYRAEDHQTPIEEIEELLGYISPSCDYATWLEVLMALHAFTGGSQEGFSIADRWSSASDKYKGSNEIATKWRSFKSGGVASGTLAHHAQRAGADLSEIRIKHMKIEPYDEVEAKMIADALFASFERRENEKAVREAVQFSQQAGGVLSNAQTGEVIDEGHGVKDGGDWTNPGGLIGDIAGWIVENSPLPNRRLAIAAALSFMSVISCRHRSTPSFSGGLQLFTICTGQSGIGKDWPLKAIDRLARECGLSHLMTSGKITTSLALENSITRAPCQLVLVDEIGRRIFAKANNKRAGTYESSMIDTLLELWSSSPRSIYKTTTRVSSDAVVVEGAAVSLFGVSTHRDFYSSLGRASIDNGMVNRLLIIEADARSSLRSDEMACDVAPPTHILDAIENLKPETNERFTSGAQAYIALEGVFAKPVLWGCDEPRHYWIAFREEMLALADNNTQTASFISRAAEMALRLACLHTLSRFGSAGMIAIESMMWGVNVVRESVQNALYGAENYIVTSEFQENVKRVEGIIKGKDSVQKSVLARKLGGAFDNRTLDNILANLLLCGKIVEKGGNKGKSYGWVV